MGTALWVVRFVVDGTVNVACGSFVIKLNEVHISEFIEFFIDDGQVLLEDGFRIMGILNEDTIL